jgi:putative addiction module component (TIGR02574 family)
MSADERLATDATDGPFEAAWAAELDKRAKELQSGAVKAVPWEEVRARVISKLQARRANRSP